MDHKQIMAEHNSVSSYTKIILPPEQTELKLSLCIVFLFCWSRGDQREVSSVNSCWLQCLKFICFNIPAAQDAASPPPENNTGKFFRCFRGKRRKICSHWKISLFHYSFRGPLWKYCEEEFYLFTWICLPSTAAPPSAPYGYSYGNWRKKRWVISLSFSHNPFLNQLNLCN